MGHAMASRLAFAVLLGLACLTLGLDEDLQGDEATDDVEGEHKTDKRERPSARGPTTTKERNFYDYKAKTINGKDMELDEFRGRVLLVVNVASQCGFTDGHYKALVRLYQTLSPTGKFTVLGFPCNQFGAQEPDADEKILDFVQKTYNVEFPMFSKVNVMEPHTHSIFKYLKEKTGKTPNWNFWKYLVNHKGEVIGVYPPWMDVEEISLDVRGAVNDAVQADPRDKQSASGPPQHEHEDYGDGAGGGLNIWSEGKTVTKEETVGEQPLTLDAPGNYPKAQRAGSKPETNPSERMADPPTMPWDSVPLRGVEGVNTQEVLKPGLHPATHDDL